MRDYGKLSPRFWIGETGRSLRGNVKAQLLAAYLVSCPTSDMTGAFYCPLTSMAHETGLDLEAPSKPLRSPLQGVKQALIDLEKAGFCFYDYENEWVFVYSMAFYQIGDSLKPTDKRVVGIKKYLDSMPKTIRQRFVNAYTEPFSLGLEASPIEGPSKPLRSQEQEQEQEQEQDIYAEPAAPSRSVVSKKNLSVPNPDGVEQDQWARYLKLRRDKHLPLTVEAFALLEREAKKAGLTTPQAIQLCLEHSWAGFKAEWMKKESATSTDTGAGVPAFGKMSVKQACFFGSKLAEIVKDGVPRKFRDGAQSWMEVGQRIADALIDSEEDYKVLAELLVNKKIVKV